MMDDQFTNEEVPTKAESNLEPWLTGTHTDIEPVLRAVLHALELAQRDVERWALPLTVEQIGLKAFGLPSVAYQVRHIVRSLNRLLTYAEGLPLSDTQFAALRSEADEPVNAEALRVEFKGGMQVSMERLLRFKPEQFAERREVGRDRLPTTVAGLLIHVADHTQRHVGQAVTTAKLVAALQGTEQS